MSADFSELSLKPELLQSLEELNYTQMTAIQAQSLPLILQAQDVIAQAQTGSGKTCAFSLGLLQRLEVKRFRIQSLVICPTRELADQVATEIRAIARRIHNIKVLTLCGGMPLGPQIGSLEHGAHIIVGTPGRLLKHLQKGTLHLDDVNTLVLDEADRMLDMGFIEDIEDIVERCPKQRQTLLFSATYPDKIEQLSRRFMYQAARITVQNRESKPAISQHFYSVANEQQRAQSCATLLMAQQAEKAIIFCNTRIDCQQLADTLKQQGFSAAALHGDLDQKQRDMTLLRFANHSVNILIATDVAARGIDVEAMPLVINYQLSREEEVHVHRVGRTGRAGSEGLALSLVLEQEEYRFKRLLDYLGIEKTLEALPAVGKIDPMDLKAPMQTLEIDGGKRSKVRPGDIVGALTAEKHFSGNDIGKIKVMPNRSFVAVRREDAKMAFRLLSEGKIKGRSFRCRIVHH